MGKYDTFSTGGWNLIYLDVHPPLFAPSYWGFYWYGFRNSSDIFMKILSYRVFPAQPFLTPFLFDLSHLIGLNAPSEISSLLLKLLGACTILQFTCSRHQALGCDSQHTPSRPFPAVNHPGPCKNNPKKIFVNFHEKWNSSIITNLHLYRSHLVLLLVSNTSQWIKWAATLPLSELNCRAATGWFSSVAPNIYALIQLRIGYVFLAF